MSKSYIDVKDKQGNITGSVRFTRKRRDFVFEEFKTAILLGVKQYDTPMDNLFLSPKIKTNRNYRIQGKLCHVFVSGFNTKTHTGVLHIHVA